MYIADFQLGCESNQKKVNLIKPNQQLPDIENFPLFMILEEPEFGIVYQNAEKKRCFLRFEEIQKFSNGTLKMIRMKLNNKLNEDKNVKKKMDQTERDLILRVLHLIQDRLEYRNTIRRLKLTSGFVSVIDYRCTLLQRGRMLGISNCNKDQG